MFGWRVKGTKKSNIVDQRKVVGEVTADVKK